MTFKEKMKEFRNLTAADGFTLRQVDMERDFQETLAKCRRVTKESLKNMETFYKIVGPIVKFIAPLM